MTDIKPPASSAALSKFLRDRSEIASLPQLHVEKEAPLPRQWHGVHSGVLFRCIYEEGFPTLSMTIDGPLPAIISYTCENEETIKSQADIFDFGFEVARNQSSFSDEVIKSQSMSLIYFRNYIQHTGANLHAQIEARAKMIEVNQENLRNLAQNRKCAATILSVSDRVHARLKKAVDPYLLSQIENVNVQTEH